MLALPYAEPLGLPLPQGERLRYRERRVLRSTVTFTFEYIFSGGKDTTLIRRASLDLYVYIDILNCVNTNKEYFEELRRSGTCVVNQLGRIS